MKKIISVVSSAALVMAGALSLSIPVSAENHTEDIYGSDSNHCHTSIYYEKTTKEIYMSGYDYWHSGSSGGQKYWYYKINDKNKYEQQMRIAESANDTSGYKYYKDLKECTQQEFEEALYQYEKNDKLTKVDIDKGFSKVNPTDYKMTDIDIPDYSYIRNITLDVQENTSAALEPKIMLYGTDIDLKVTWKSSDSKIAEVDSEGRVTAKAEGSCTVTSEIEGIGAVETYNITVEPYMTETEKAVRTIIKNYDSGSITEKDMFNQVYALDEYNAAGHVITDIDGDDQYEMVTRSPDKKVIKIYERSGDNIVLAKTLTGVDRANMLYVHNNGSVNVFFQTVKNITANKKEIKIFGYKGAESMMSNPLVCSIEKNVNDSTDYLCYDSNGNKFDVLYGTDEYSYLYNSWRESFNDNCYTVSPETQTQAVCSGEGDSWGVTIDIWGNFISNYYNENDRESIFEDHGYSLRPALIQQMAINEIIGRYNYKFQDPESTALFNKNSSYNPDPSITKEDIFAKFNEYEKFNYDHLGLITGGQA